MRNNIIAGCDPTEEILKGSDPLEWCLKYIEEVSEHVAGIKVNPKFFFKFPNGNEIMKKIAELCKQKDLVSIFDEKLSEVGHSNFEGVRAAKVLGYDFITIAAYAGNAKEVINFCRENNIGSINMGLMSNPEFLRESTYINPVTGKNLWQDRLEESLEAGADWLVLGGTYEKENIYFQEFLKRIKDEKVKFLVPGIGAQGGDLKIFLETVKLFGLDQGRFMLNVGRDLMSKENRKEAAKNMDEQSKLLK